MVQYFFHLRDGSERLFDPHGICIDDPARIADIALKEVRALIAQEALDGKIDLAQRLEVGDKDGRLVHSVRFKDAVRILGA